jgi:Gene product 88
MTNTPRKTHGIRKYKVPATSKMPGPSWSLPAHRACPRANGTICDSCYAERGCYQYRSTVNAQDVRFNWTRECMRTPEGRETWISTMVDAISGQEYFRVHNSGDMYSPAYAECWYQICQRLPDTRFWIPTRAWQQPSGPLSLFDPLLHVLRKLALLPNVSVRPSALSFGDHAPSVPGLHAGTTASQPDVFRAAQCPAPLQDGHCGDCRTCWDVKDLPVSYSKH